MKSNEVKEYANTLMAMTTDYLMGNYEEELYKRMVLIIAEQINEPDDDLAWMEQKLTNNRG